MQFIENKSAVNSLKSDHKEMTKCLLALRQLIVDVAAKESVPVLEEALKWGQASYIAKQGSTIRIAEVDSQHYALYVHCQSSLIETYKEIYGDTFTYNGNRAVVFSLHENLPVSELAHCIAMALRYHKLKHLPLLGN